MTISSTTRIAGPFLSGTALPYTFKVFAAADLNVVRLNTSTGVETSLVLGSDYTVALNGNQNTNPGGTVNLTVAASATSTVTITSDIANLQPTDLTNQGGFYPEVITDSLDRATIQIQQMSEDVGRSLKGPISDGNLNMELPTAAQRANSFLAFDANGVPTAVVSGSTGAPTTITRQVFSGTGSQTVFTLASDPGALGNSAQVFIGGIYQQRSTYTIAGTTLTFSSAPVAGTDNIEFVNYLTSNIGATSADLVTYTPSGTGAVARSAASKFGETVSVKDFGAVGDGVANDRQAIKNAISATITNGGGTIVFPRGTYLISGFETTVNIPELDGNLQYAPAAYQAQIYVSSASNINFKFDGAVLQSNKTNGGITLLFDGCSNIMFENLNMNGATVMSGTTVTTTGTEALAFVSLTQDSQNITLTNTRITNHYTSCDIAGDPVSATKVTNVTFVGSTYFATGYYGLACRGNGTDVVVQNMYNYQMNRAFFIYDTNDVSVNGTVDFLPTSGFSPLVKCYTTNTTNIKMNCVYKNKSNVVTPRLQFHSQHNPAVQPTPAYLRDIFVTYTEEACGSGGSGIEFDYYQNNTLTSTTSSVIFDGITIIGRSNNNLTTTVDLTSLSNVCLINIDDFVANNGKTILDDTGFVAAKQFTYNPTLEFGGASTGITYSAQSGKYYIQGGVCTVIGEFTLSSKGSATGSAAITMPFRTREDSSNLPMTTIVGVSGMSGLGGPMLGYIQAASGNLAVLFSQGATGISNITDTSFTNSSRVLFQAIYPI